MEIPKRSAHLMRASSVAARVAGRGSVIADATWSPKAATADIRDETLAPPLMRHRWLAILARVGLLAVVDILALAAATVLAFSLWAAPVHGQPLQLYSRLWPLLGLFALIYWRKGLYPGFGLGGVEILRRLSLATSLVFLVLTALDFVLKLPRVYSRMTILLLWGFALVLVPLGRFLFLLAVHRLPWWGEPCIVLGTGPIAEHTVV